MRTKKQNNAWLWHASQKVKHLKKNKRKSPLNICTVGDRKKHTREFLVWGLSEWRLKLAFAMSLVRDTIEGVLQPHWFGMKQIIIDEGVVKFLTDDQAQY